jgi:hypothetical protein
LIREAVKADTRKLDSFEDFCAGLEGTMARGVSLKGFAGQRRAYLLSLAP